MYEFSGAVVHMGEAGFGHYLSLVKEGPAWFKFNDAVVSPFDAGVGLEEECYGGEEEVVQKTANTVRPPLLPPPPAVTPSCLSRLAVS